MAQASFSKVGLLSVTVLLLVTLCTSDIAQDREECANQLAGLATCLPYVGGEAKAPTQDCCTGLKQVLKASKKCLCILVKDRNDPSLGLKINATLALNLPQICHSPTSISDCPALLHLPPNSPDAKVFDDFSKDLAHLANATAPASGGKSGGGGGGTSAKETSDNNAKGTRQLVAQMFYGVLLWCFVSHLVFLAN